MAQNERNTRDEARASVHRIARHGFSGDDREHLEQAIRDHVVARVIGYHSDGDRAANDHGGDGVYFRTLLGALLEPDPRYFHTILEHLTREQAPLIAVCETLVVPIANELGRMWLNDTETFVSISIASSRLQSLINQLAQERNLAARGNREKKILLARMPGDDHTLGLTVIAACFSEEGWTVDGGADLEAGDAAFAMLANGDYSIFGVSLGTRAHLDGFASIVARTHGLRVSRKPKIGVGGPVVAANPEIYLDIGADFAAADARQAVSFAEDMIR